MIELRDYFAAAALASLSAWFTQSKPDNGEMASQAYGIADAMLAERTARPGPAGKPPAVDPRD